MFPGLKRSRAIIVLAVFFFAFTFLTADQAGGNDGILPLSTPGPVADSLPFQPIENVPFGVGERLRYHLDFSSFRAGLSEMRIVDVDSSCGAPSYHFRSRVQSTATVDLIYKVRDVVESWFDVEGLFSRRFERRIREGGFRQRKFFDYDNRTGWVSVSNENGPKGVEPFVPFSHNIISALYWVRTQPLEAGKDLYLQLHDLNKQYTLRVIVYGLEEVRVPAGRFRCWKVEPVVESEGLFRATGRLWVWFTDDERRIPVQMKSKIAVGSIMGRLVEYRPGVPYAPGVVVPDDSSDSKWDW